MKNLGENHTQTHLDFLKQHHIIYPHQYGFIPKKNSTCAIIQLIGQIITGKENKNTLAVFLILQESI